MLLVLEQSAAGEEHLVKRLPYLRVRVDGPLAPFIVGFKRELTERGYALSALSGHLQLMAHLSGWLGELGVDPGDVTLEQIKGFVRHRRAISVVHKYLTLQGVGIVIEYLREIGVVPRVPPVVSPDAMVELMGGYADFLIAERGFAAGTVRNYQRVAWQFVAACRDARASKPFRVEDLSADDVVTFVLSEAVRLRGGALSAVTNGLRAWLRYVHLQGMCSELAPVVPSAPRWRSGGESKALDPGVVARLLASCDRGTPVGERDFAILTCLVRLGVRSGEIAGLSLDDVDWLAGEIRIRGKGAQLDVLPLPVDVGAAMAAYCARGRRQGRSRAMFLHSRAPYGALSSRGIAQVVARACDRCGLARVGAHRLRHTAATALRRAGAPLIEVAELLRHRNVATTALYASDGIDTIARVARPWPLVRA
jgi:integrase/recombinase XerD